MILDELKAEEIKAREALQLAIENASPKQLDFYQKNFDILVACRAFGIVAEKVIAPYHENPLKLLDEFFRSRPPQTFGNSAAMVFRQFTAWHQNKLDNEQATGHTSVEGESGLDSTCH